MIEPFERELNGDSTGLTLTPIVPKMKEGSEWFFNEHSVATREYNGYLMRQTNDGWQYYQPSAGYYEYPEDPAQLTGYQAAAWLPVYGKVSYFRQGLQVLQGTWRNRNSAFLHVQEFEDAELLFAEEYENGEYWLVPPGDKWYLVPVNSAEQLSNINSLDIHLIGDVETVFQVLQEAMSPLRDNIYGAIFTTEDGRRARVRPRDFDWKEYDTRRDRDSHS